MHLYGIFWFFYKSPEKIIGDCFDKSVKTATKDVDEPMLAGVIVFSALANTYDSLKHDNAMLQKCGLSKSEYLELLEDILNKKGRKYISNWNQMKRRSQSNYMDLDM